MTATAGPGGSCCALFPASTGGIGWLAGKHTTCRERHVKNTAILLIDCPDRKGIVAAVGDFLYRHNANILHADQHQDAERNLFLMRVEWDLNGFDISRA